MVIAEDNGFDMRRSSTSQITLLLVDNANRHSPILDRVNYIVDVPEDTSPNDIIVSVTASDGDDPDSPAGQIANFILTGSGSIYFRVMQDVANNFIGHIILK